MSEIFGVDISRYQDNSAANQWINQAKFLSRDICWVAHRIAWGVQKDTSFVRNWGWITLPRFFYHYIHLSETINDQLNVMKAQFGSDPGEFPEALDIEYNSANDGAQNDPLKFPKRINYLRDLLDGMDQITGKKTMIYTRYSLWTQYFAQPADTSVYYEPWWELGERDLWIAHYSSDNRIRLSAPTIPLPFKTWQIWQFADKNDAGHYYGVQSHSIDLDVMQSDYYFGHDVWDDDDIEPEPPPVDPRQKLEVTAEKLNIREDHDSASKDIGDLYQGAIVEQYDYYFDNRWAWVLHASGWSCEHEVIDGNLYTYMVRM